ncbi:MAG: hypothetical protein H6R15_3202 [Proteobacteria bacterium]|nr:hypothetical protein [Pseudomonadota bacterium]
MNSLRRFLVALGISLCLMPGPSWAERPWEEIVRETEIAKGNITQAQGVISAAEQRVQEAFSKVQTAEHFEGPHWVTLEKAMGDYSTTFKAQLKTIDSNVKALLKLNPAADVPYIEFNPPQIKPSLKAMETVRDDLRRAVLKAKKFKADRQQDRAKIALEMEGRTEEQFKDVAFDLAGVPLNGDGSIDYGDLTASLLPFPAQLINTGLSLTFGLYFYAEEMKAGVFQIKTFKDQIAYADLAIERAEANVRSAEQGIQFLTGYREQRDKLLADFYEVRRGWVGAADQSKQEKKKEESQEFQKEMERPKVGASSYYEPPLQPSEIEPEANGVLKELQSAALAAMQGGDPDAFHGIMLSYVKSYRAKHEQNRNAVKQASDAANQAHQGMLRAIQQAEASYLAAVRGRCNCDPVFKSAGEAYNRAYQAAYASMTPYYAATNRAYREQSRVYWVTGIIRDGVSMLNRQMNDYASNASMIYHRTFGQNRRDFDNAITDFYAMNGVLPDRYSLEYLKRYVAELDDSIQHDLRWGRDPASLRSGLLAYAESVRLMGESVKRNVPEYKKASLEAAQVAKQYVNELNGMLDKDAMIIASSWDGSLSRMYWPSGDWDNWERAGDERKQRIADNKKWIEDSFKIYERTDLDVISSFPYDALARQIEEKAAGLEAIVDRLETFKFRLASANGKLDKVSRQLTGLGIYTARPKAAIALATEELTRGGWASLGTAVENAIDPATREQAKKYVPFYASGIGVRPKLLAAQAALYAVAQVDMKNYIQLRSQSQNYFAPVHPDQFKPLETQWQALSPLYAQFDNLAASERLVLDQNPLPDSRPLAAAFAAIPEGQRGPVQESYRRFYTEQGYLNTYLTTKLEALQPLSDISRNNVKGYLDEWIGGYPKALQEYKEREERMQREAAERAKRQEEENRRRTETDLASVKTLYQKFAEAYQRRDLRAVVRFMGANWQAADGTDIGELEDTLSNSFRVFDTVTFSISGMNIRQIGVGSYEVTYDVQLVGRMTRRNIKHEEKSRVTDIVDVLPDGPVISRTSGGTITIR